MDPKIKKVVELYNKVQKIPYYCLVKRDVNLLFKKKKGCCFEKNVFLGKEFKKMGIPVKYILVKFDWNDLPIPKEVLKKRKNGSLSSHLALKIKINRKWIYVDATWDPKLEKSGFPVTRNWDGVSDTKLAVPPKEITELKKPPPEKIELPEDREFFTALNRWLESQRKTHSKSEKITEV